MEGLITFDEDFDRILLTRIMKTQKSFATGYSDSGLCLTAAHPSCHPGSAPFLCQVQTKIPNDITISLTMWTAERVPISCPHPLDNVSSL